MKIGIDISQLAYEGTGVANFLKNLVENLLQSDTSNEYILLYTSLRKELPSSKFWLKGNRVLQNKLPSGAIVTIKRYKIPPTLLDVLWNRLHILPVEKLIGPVDIFLSSDWTQPPTNAKKATILYDLIIYKYPKEMANKIVSVQKRRMQWVKKEVDRIICISEATKNDAVEFLGINKERLSVVYPGL